MQHKEFIKIESTSTHPLEKDITNMNDSKKKIKCGWIQIEKTLTIDANIETNLMCQTKVGANYFNSLMSTKIHHS